MPPPTTKASDAVAGFLSALAGGHAAEALSYSATQPGDAALVSDAVLAQSLKRAPLTAIDVPEVADPAASEVTARYTLGSTPVTETFAVTKVGDQWKVQQAYKELDLTLVRQPSVPMRINGVKVSGSRVSVLPGSYAFTTGHAYLDYGNRSTLLVRSPTDSTDVFTVRAQLSSAGRKAAIAAAKKSYAKCLKATKLLPKNCPNSYPNSAYTYSRVTWTQSGKDPFPKARTALVGSSVLVTVKVSYKLAGPCSRKGVRYNCTGTLKGDSRAIVAVLKKPATVRWN